jgi:two-component system chemotaxis sensor kinase CheA
MFQKANMDDLLPDFLIEAHESLGELEIALVRLEKAPQDKATLSSIFRHVHTIKGTCGFLGLSRLEHAAHAAEEVLGKYRDGIVAVTPDSISLILRALDTFKEIVAGIAETGAEPAGDDSALVDALNAVAAGAAPAPVAEAAAVAEVARPDSPEPEAPAPTPPASVAPASVAPASVAPASVPAGASPAAKTEAAATTIRVTVDVLENLMTLVSELVLTRNQLLQTARAEEGSAFAVPLQRLTQITSDLQEGVMKTRMQPVGTAWTGLPRLVRDLSLELGKRIELVMRGADTELDRQLLELIRDPLTHMVRNSGDHGLESTAERRAAGKPETGRITLNAYHEGGHILIEISDDGRGLPVDRIRKKIIANGLATEAAVAEMSELQIQSFIFHVGFSTAAVVSSVSGRGVGMDVVKTNITRIGGTIDLKSEAGVGTSFTIKIPLTLAIVSALIIEASGERFAIPQIGLVELVRAGVRGPANAARPAETDGAEHAAGQRSGSFIEQINQTPMLRLRGQLLPLVHLGGLLKLGDAGVTPSAEPTGEHYIVVNQVGATRFGIIVDRVFDTEEIVVKPVAPILRQITMFSGNTILGDGSVIMILDPNGIARAIGIGTRPANNAAAQDDAQVQGANGKTALLLFRAGGTELKAVPLSLVSRLEEVERERIEWVNDALVTQYRGKLMPLIGIGGAEPSSQGQAAGETARQAVLVLADGDRTMGLMVDEIVNVVEDVLTVSLRGDRPGFLGTAIVNARATAIIDAGFWLKRAFADWFAPGTGARNSRPSVLVVEDSAFFRGLLTPALSAAGFELVAVPDALAALKLRDAGRMFDLILSDIEMPEMDGFAFAAAVRGGGPWRELPMIALSGRSSAADIERGRQAGFDDHVSKLDHGALLSAIAERLGQPAVSGAPTHAARV